MNTLHIIGNLTRNPETRVVNGTNGQATVCNFTVAVNRLVRGQKVTDYFRVSCWNRQAENAAKYLAKGRKAAVSGAVTARAYTTDNGEARASLEVFAEKIEYLSGGQDNGSQTQDAPTDDGFVPVDDEELPF